jgi:hypothetical protein
MQSGGSSITHQVLPWAALKLVGGLSQALVPTSAELPAAGKSGTDAVAAAPAWLLLWLLVLLLLSLLFALVAGGCSRPLLLHVLEPERS